MRLHFHFQIVYHHGDLNNNFLQIVLMQILHLLRVTTAYEGCAKNNTKILMHIKIFFMAMTICPKAIYFSFLPFFYVIL